MRLLKQDRLLSERDFSKVLGAAHRRGQGHIVHRPPYVLYCSVTDADPRIGVSIARRVLKKAHERNRVRRVIKEFFRMNKSHFEGDVVIRLSKRPDDFEFGTLVSPFKELKLK